MTYILKIHSLINYFFYLQRKPCGNHLIMPKWPKSSYHCLNDLLYLISIPRLRWDPWAGTDPPTAPGRRNMAAHCSRCVFTAVSVHLYGLNAEDKFRVWVTILGHTPLPFPFLPFLNHLIIAYCRSCSVFYRSNFIGQLPLLAHVLLNCFLTFK